MPRRRDTEHWGLRQPFDASIPLRGSGLNKLRKLMISVELLDQNGRRGCRSSGNSLRYLGPVDVYCLFSFFSDGLGA